MPVKIARSTPRPSFGLPELLVASHISRLASRDAAKSLLSTLVSASSGECRINAPSARPYPRPSEPSAPAGQAPALAADVPSPHPLTCPPNQCAVRFQHRCRWRMLLNWLPYYVQRTSRGLRLGQA